MLILKLFQAVLQIKYDLQKIINNQHESWFQNLALSKVTIPEVRTSEELRVGF